MEEENDKCSICHYDMEHKTTTFVCNHEFCQFCLTNWYKNCKKENKPVTCPICRKVDNIWGS